MFFIEIYFTIINIFLIVKEEVDYIFTIKLYKKRIITMLSKPFKESNKAEVKALVNYSVFYIITYNKKAYSNTYIFKLYIVYKVKGKNK